MIRVQDFIEFRCYSGNVDNAELICWNCLERTLPGECSHCGVALSNPGEAFEEEKTPQVERILEIRRQNKENIRIKLDLVVELVERNFSIVNMQYGSGPQFRVEHPGPALTEKFDNLLQDSQELEPGFKPMVKRFKKTDDLLIQYVYNDPPAPSEYRTVILLGIFTIVSIFLSGIFNYSQLIDAKGAVSEGLTVPFFNIVLSLPSFLFALQFTIVLVLLLAIKDSIQLGSMFSNFKNKITPFYIPAPPIFELGTFGSVNKQDSIHKTRSEMFRSMSIGPLAAWVISVILLAVTLPLSEYNPSAASSYANHSIVAGGSFEPLMLTFLAMLTNAVGITDFVLTTPFTHNYLLHPLTMAALSGFYLVSLSLLPMAHYNGGLMVRAALGKRAHMFFTYASIAAIYFVSWVIAIFVFFIHELLKTPEILNDETEVPQHYKLLLLPLLLIILLSYPFQMFIIEYLLSIIV